MTPMTATGGTICERSLLMIFCPVCCVHVFPITVARLLYGDVARCSSLRVAVGLASQFSPLPYLLSPSSRPVLVEVPAFISGAGIVCELDPLILYQQLEKNKSEISSSQEKDGTEGAVVSPENIRKQKKNQKKQKNIRKKHKKKQIQTKKYKTNIQSKSPTT